MNKLFKVMLSSLAAMCFVVSAYAQMTTSSMTGRITDASGESVPGATVVAVHTPSGSQYYAVANVEGYYTIQGMRPGGPYEISVQMLGFQTVKYQDIALSLSETYKLNASLKDDSQMLNEVVVVANSTNFTVEKTGASTNVSNREMMNLPNSDRSIKAIAKLSPYSNGMSFAGSDGRSTNFTIDGSNLNNNFGLSSNLPGGGNPVSLDAIEEMQIVVAPYDVRQSNFVGGGINAVTKSGTNTFKGTAYAYYTNQNFRGNKIEGKDLGDRKDESNRILGFTLGGPIIKDKLFFFVNFETQKMPEQAVKYQPTEDAKVQLEKIRNRLVNDYGYNPGSYTDFPGGTDNMKMLARIDWNISDAHKLSFRFNKTNNEYWYAPNGNSCDDSFRNKSYNRSSAKSFPFSSNLYSQMNNVTSFAAELNSRLSDNLSNRFLATYTNIDDTRGSNASPFPHIDIMTEGLSGYDHYADKGNFVPFTSLGYELFTWNNGVKNKSINVSDNITYYLGSHTITAGASWEYMNALNSYMRNGTGYYRFASVDDFLNGKTPVSFCLTYGYDGNENPAGEVAYNQFGLYGQDEWNITPDFKLTYGLRFDLLAYDDSTIITNPNIKDLDFNGRSIDTGAWPKTRPQVSPRIGFNWDVNGDKSIVLRGGTGIFQGRLPLVFFTNMPQYSGMIQGSYGVSGSKGTDGAVFTPEQTATLQSLVVDGKVMTDMKAVASKLNLPTQPSATSAGFGGNASYGYIVGVDPNFRMPQIWKTSIAVDYRVPVNFPFTVTAEGMFNKTIWGVCMEDWNENSAKLQESRFAGVDNRVNYKKASGYTYTDYSMYTMTNTNKGWGYTANITLNAEPVKNLKIMAAYTHTEAKEISGMPGSAANSVYTGMPTVNGTNLSGLQRSQYVLPDKIMASIDYFIPWKVFGGDGLHLNAYYSAYSSYGNSFIYSNDMNGDGNAADLMYIPASKNEIQIGTLNEGNYVADAAMADAFWKFVENDRYLSAHKGEYAEAYAARAPFVHRIDFRIAEDFTVKVGGTKHKLQASASIDNFGNMLNSNWGLQKMSCYQSELTGTISPLKYEGADASGKPVFSMPKVGDAYPTQNYTNTLSLYSECWQVLFSLKYFFN